ncbi:MAG: class I fructose-bisphosphate aldolase, partial [Myxococcota bacterium]
QMEAAIGDFAGRIPTILKLNNSESLYSTEDPCPAITSSVKDAVYMGCSAIGFTIYPGSAQRATMYGQIQEIAAEAKAAGLLTVIWSYPRGSGLSKKGETAIDVVAYAAQVAAQLGAQIVKVKPPHEGIEQDAARKVYEKEGIKIDTMADRIRHVVQSTFNGRRVIIFSGGASKTEEEVLDEIRGIHTGGGFGSIMGRNAFQRSKADALSLLGKVQDIYMS